MLNIYIMLKKVAKYIHYVMIKIHNVKKIQKIHNVHEKIHIVINVQIYYD